MIIKALLRLVVMAGALLLIGRFVPGVSISSLYIAIIVAILWGIITLTIRPVLLLLTLPINILTLGLFTFVLNALLFWFLSSFIAGFSVAGFIPAIEATVLLSLVTWVLHIIL